MSASVEETTIGDPESALHLACIPAMPYKCHISQVLNHAKAYCKQNKAQRTRGRAHGSALTTQET